MKHIFKIPFIIFWGLLVYELFSELGKIQTSVEYVITYERLFAFSVMIGFISYGMYASIRDVFLLLFKP